MEELLHDTAPRAAWLRFSVEEADFALPLERVSEVTETRRPCLIPLVAREAAGVLNLRGEPLPVVDSGPLLGHGPGTRRHALILERGRTRIGLLVDAVSHIERDLVPNEPASEEVEGPVLVEWAHSKRTRIGLIDAEVLLARASEVLRARN